MSALANYDITKGDTGVVTETGPSVDTNVSTGSWACRITVSTKAGAAPIIDRAVTEFTADNFKFLAYLTPTETDGLTLGTYLQTIEISNATLTPILNEEKHYTINIKEQGAA